MNYSQSPVEEEMDLFFFWVTDVVGVCFFFVRVPCLDGFFFLVTGVAPPFCSLVGVLVAPCLGKKMELLFFFHFR